MAQQRTTTVATVDPKPAEAVRALEARVTSFEVVPVTDAGTYTRGGLNLRELKTLQDEVEHEEKKATTPLNAALQVVRGWFRPMKDRLQQAEVQQRRQLGDYKTAEDRREAEERRKREAAAQVERDKIERDAREREERGRREAEEKRRQADAARRAGDTAAAAKLESQAVATVARADAAVGTLLARAEAVVPDPVATEAPKVEGLGNRKVWRYEILNPAKLNPLFLIADETKIRKQVGALKADAVAMLGGPAAIRVWEEDDFSARRTR